MPYDHDDDYKKIKQTDDDGYPRWLCVGGVLSVIALCTFFATLLS